MSAARRFSADLRPWEREFLTFENRESRKAAAARETERDATTHDGG